MIRVSKVGELVQVRYNPTLGENMPYQRKLGKITVPASLRAKIRNHGVALAPGVVVAVPGGNLRRTTIRAAVEEVIAEIDGPFTARDVKDRLLVNGGPAAVGSSVGGELSLAVRRGALVKSGRRILGPHVTLAVYEKAAADG